MSASKIRPTGKNVLVAPLPPPTKTTTGIVLAEHWQQPTGRAVVLSVGQAVRDLQPGDQICYSWINGRDVEHEGTTRRLLHQEEVLAIILPDS